MNTHPYPPGPRPGLLPGGPVWALQRDPTAYLAELARQYGDIVHFRVGPRHFYLLNHPDFIQDVLVTHSRKFIKSQALRRTRLLLGEGLLTSEGELHQQQRRLIQPAFHRARLTGYTGTMAEYAGNTSTHWLQMLQDRTAVVDMHAEMSRLSLQIVGKTLLGLEVEAEAGLISQALDTLVAVSDLAFSPLGGVVRYLPLPSTRRFEQAKAQLDGLVRGLIAARRRLGPQDDLLSTLLFSPASEAKELDDQQVQAEVLTLLLAGHETIANALSWTWYLLAQHPPEQTALQVELEQALQGRLPAADDVDRLPYTRMVLTEAMRLYPPAWILGREVVETHCLGGYCLPRGATILMSQWVMHHDPRYYPDPYRFVPLRWTLPARGDRPQFAYFPFGGGPRRCIGEAFALQEGVIVLAALAQRWQAQPVAGYSAALLPTITLRPRDGMKMVLSLRKTGKTSLPFKE